MDLRGGRFLILNKNIKSIYFSATGATRKIVTGIAGRLSGNSSGGTTQEIDFTSPRREPAFFI